MYFLMSTCTASGLKACVKATPNGVFSLYGIVLLLSCSITGKPVSITKPVLAQLYF